MLAKNKKERRCIMRKPYNTPHRTHVVKTRLTDEEHELFLNQCRTYGISQSEMLRQSMTRLQIKPVIHVSAVNDELLAAVGKLTAEYGRRQLKPNSPDAERVAQPLPAACRGGTGGSFRPCCPKV